VALPRNRHLDICSFLCKEAHVCLYSCCMTQNAPLIGRIRSAYLMLHPVLRLRHGLRFHVRIARFASLSRSHSRSLSHASLARSQQQRSFHLTLWLHPNFPPTSTSHEGGCRVVRRTAECTRRVRDMRRRTMPRLIVFAAGPCSPMLSQPFLSVAAALSPARGRLDVLQAAQPALTERVIIARIEAPADRQRAECPAVAPLRALLALITALLRRARLVRHTPR